jgi:hypothetical protein
VLEPRIEVALPLCAGGSASASAGAATATASAAASGRLGRQRRASRSRLERLRVWVEGRVICGLGRAHNDAYHGGAVLHERRGLQLYPASPALQASSNEQIKHIIRKLHAVLVQPQQPQDKSLGGDVEHQMIFARPLDHFQTLIVLLYGYLLLDPETSLVPSGEKATELIDEPLWALVFAVTHLMSVAIILRTRERKRCLGCMRAFGSMEIWDHSTARLQARKAQTCNSQQRAARMSAACGSEALRERRVTCLGEGAQSTQLGGLVTGGPRARGAS